MLVAALAWTLYHMLQNPDVTERCRKEVDEVMEGRSFPTHEDLKKMKQLDLIMKESMRLTPVSPMGSARDLNADAEICGFAVPKGTSVWVPFYPLFTDAKLWEDPMAFKPERFLDISSSDPKYMPFSAGPRNCTSTHGTHGPHTDTTQASLCGVQVSVRRWRSWSCRSCWRACSRTTRSASPRTPRLRALSRSLSSPGTRRQHFIN